MANKKISDYTAQTTLASGDLLLMQRGSTYYKVDQDNILSGQTTDNLTEGASALYFTNERAQDAVGGMLTDANGLVLTYDDAGATITPSYASGYEPIRTITKSIDHTEILDLNSTPIDLGITPEVNKCIMILEAFAYFNCAGGASYTNSGFSLIDQSSSDIYYSWSSSFLNNTVSKYANGFKGTDECYMTPNRSILVKANTSNPANGATGNRLTIHVKYQYTPDLSSV